MASAMLLAVFVAVAIAGAAGSTDTSSGVAIAGAAGSTISMPGLILQLIDRGTEYEPTNRRYHASCAFVYDSNELCGMGEAVPATFFHEEKAHVGETISAYFPRASLPRLGFLGRHVAQRIPFSAANFTQILDQLHIAAGSEEAVDMLSTLRFCDRPPHHSYCVTSYEDMVERAANLLGTPDVRAMASVLPRDGAALQPYTVRAVKPADGSEFVACHAEMYPYAVYICHKSTHTSAYVLDMENSLGSGRKIELVTMCHRNTSGWDRRHVAFDILGSKPGGLPICHVMPYGHLAFGKLGTSISI